MKHQNKIRIELQRIHDIIQLMEYSEDSFLDLRNYMNKVVELTESINTNNMYDDFLNQVYQTKTKQLENLERNYNSVEDRKDYFDDLKDNFLIDFSFLDVNG